MGNGVAYLALFGFLPFGIAVFAVFRPPVAALICFLASFMFLPELTVLDLPGLPGLGKQEVAALACLFGVFLRARRRLWNAKPFRGPDLFVLLMFVGDVGTALTNKDVITHGPTVLPALSTYEAVSMMMFDFLRYLLPFLLGRALFSTAKDLRQCLTAIAIAGVIYTPFLFIELMMSPQLHNWIYGYHQHDFIQTIRGGGYRPMVFMPHGLAVGLFMAWATMAALTLYKARKATFGLPSPVVAGYDFAFLVWCKSLGAAIYALTFGPLLVFLRAKTLVRICTFLALVVLTYPAMRATGLFPEKALVGIASSVASDRAAQSLGYRFEMEGVLTDHAANRWLFGWGRFRRNMVFDEYTGRDISVSDGHWIVTYSIRGVWGFLCVFGLIVAPLLVLQKRMRRIDALDERVMLAGLGAIVAVGAVDLLPNALQNVFFMFIAGVLWGCAKGMSNAGTQKLPPLPIVVVPNPPQPAPQPRPYPGGPS